jgi:hypothetical protein
MLIRFVIEKRDPDSGKRQGLFHAARELRESYQLPAADEEKLKSVRDWFNANLDRPERFTLSSKPHAKAQALSWFRDTASEHIAKMREFSDVLERHGVRVVMIKTNRAGYVLYEDDYQVTAYPFADTET